MNNRRSILLEDAVTSANPVRLADAQTGNSAALEREVVDLFDQFRNPILRFLASFGLVVPDAEEVLQEVFLSLFKHLREGKSQRNLRAWLFRVAHNLALKKRLRARRDSALQSEAVEDSAVDPGPNPEQHLARRRARLLVMAVLRALPEQDRRCIALRAEGLSYREIAGVLDISLGSVSQSLAKTLARIASATQR